MRKHTDKIRADRTSYEARFANAPEPFPPGSPEHQALLAELERLQTLEVFQMEQLTLEGDPQDDVCQSDTPALDRCPRATRLLIEDGDTTVAYRAACDSRTCGYCKDAVDERDQGRIAYSLRDYDDVYMDRVPAAQWSTIRKRAQRAGGVCIKMGDPSAIDSIVVVSSADFTGGSEVVDFGQVVTAVVQRPPIGGTEKDKARPRANILTTGVGLVTVEEWTNRERGRSRQDEAARIVHMAPGVTVRALTVKAAELGIDHTALVSGLVRLHAPWDSPAMIELRDWAKAPPGDDWETMKWETISTQRGALLTVNPRP